MQTLTADEMMEINGGKTYQCFRCGAKYKKLSTILVHVALHAVSDALSVYAIFG